MQTGGQVSGSELNRKVGEFHTPEKPRSRKIRETQMFFHGRSEVVSIISLIAFSLALPWSDGACFGATGAKFLVSLYAASQIFMFSAQTLTS